MRSDPLFYVVLASVLLVAGILLFGIGSFGRGGDFNRRNANKLMRYRIYAQAGAVAMILIFVFFRRLGG